MDEQIEHDLSGRRMAEPHRLGRAGAGSVACSTGYLVSSYTRLLPALEIGYLTPAAPPSRTSTKSSTRRAPL